jgi:hypothetical protein
MRQFNELHRRRFKTVIKDQKLFRVVHSKLVRDLLDLGMEDDKVFKQLTSESFTRKFYKNAPKETEYDATFKSGTQNDQPIKTSANVQNDDAISDDELE